MPPARGHATKTLELSAKLCTALNLIGREQIFESIKKELHKRVDLSFDLCLSSSEQPGNMEAYVQTIRKVFPGYFGKDVVQRSTALKAYIASYLDENQAALPPGDMIKVRRRSRSRTRRNSQAKPDLVFVLEPIQRPPSAPLMDLDPPEDDTPPPPEFEDDDNGVPDHGAESAVPLPSPSPPPTMDPEFASPEPEPPHPESFLMRFLESCSPSMTSRVDAFQRMGATTQEDLVGMARWHEDHLRPALHRHGIVDSLLQEEALVIGFYSLVNHWPPAAD